MSEHTADSNGHKEPNQPIMVYAFSRERLLALGMEEAELDSMEAQQTTVESSRPIDNTQQLLSNAQQRNALHPSICK